VDPLRFRRLPGDTLVVWERHFGRITSFDTLGTVLATRRLDFDRIQDVVPRGVEPGIVHILSDGSFITGSVLPATDRPENTVYRRQIVYARVYPDYSVDTLGVYPHDSWYTRRLDDGRVVQQPPLVRTRSSVSSGESPVLVYISRGDSAGAEVLDEGARLLRIVRRTGSRLPFTAADEQRVIHMIGTVMGSDQLGEIRRMVRDAPTVTHWPEMPSARVDDLGFMWVHDRRVGPNAAEWSVFDPDGRWLGRITIPLATVTDLGIDYILGMRHDEMGVESVHELSLTRAPGEDG
jgi:hypothetical protein